ncbi:MAG: hypothetical protein K8R16_09825 [Anaerolineales bacterium]|nr:hypothetical protein [Anaerolineales bacterium]
MNLTPPTKNVFYVSVVLAVLGILGSFISIPFVSGYAFWFLVVAYIVLFLGNTMKGF